MELSEIRRSLELSRAESRAVKEESTQHLTRMHELKEANELLAADLQDSIDQSQDLRARVMELGNNNFKIDKLKKIKFYPVVLEIFKISF